MFKKKIIRRESTCSNVSYCRETYAAIMIASGEQWGFAKIRQGELSILCYTQWRETTLCKNRGSWGVCGPTRSCNFAFNRFVRDPTIFIQFRVSFCTGEVNGHRGTIGFCGKTRKQSGPRRISSPSYKNSAPYIIVNRKVA